MIDPRIQSGIHVTANIRLVRLLGEGGMGSVWVADHLGLHTQVVVKFVARDLADNPEIRERFAREAALAAQAKSPHVVQVLDHGTSDLGLPYIAMELLEGEDLGQRIARDGMIAPPLFAQWLTQACKGLSRVHAKGVIHRDIKPDNIFLSDTDGEIVVKVLDFGIAKGADNPALSGTRTGALLGTAYFMSPEQTMGSRSIDLRTDLWSLGVTAYLALTGTRPFECDSIGAIVHAITSDPIPPPSSLNPALGPAIDAWMAKALARPVEERFASAKEMAEAFTQAALGLAPPSSTLALSTAPPAASAQPTVRFTTSIGVVAEPVVVVARRPIGVIAAIVASALLVGTGGYVLREAQRVPEPAPVGLTSSALALPAVETPSEGPAAPEPIPEPAVAAPVIPAVAHRATVHAAPAAKPFSSAVPIVASPSAAPNRLKMGLE